MRYLILIFLLLVASTGQGQFLRADHKKAAELMHRPLIVTVFDLEEAETYCDSIHMAWYNEYIREIFMTHWALSDSIIFMESKKVASLISAKTQDYVIFSGGPSREGQQSSGDIFWFPSFTFMLYLQEDGKRFDSKTVDRGLYGEPMVPDMEMTGQLFRGKYIFKLSFASNALSKEDLIFAVSQFDKHIREAMTDKKTKGGIYASGIPKKVSAGLKTRVLLIPAGIDTQTSDRASIEKYYKNPFQIADEDDIRSAISSRAASKAFIHYLWSDHERMFLGFVIDTESLDVLASFRPGQVRLEKADCLAAGASYRSLIKTKPKHFRNIR